MSNLKEHDFELFEAIEKEKNRQFENIELIASENYVSDFVKEVQGSILTNKYAEGYPNKRYYGGCEHVDTVETLAINRACELFNCKYANVQPHSGSQANMAVYKALLNINDKVLGMSLDHGGHLTHGHKLNFSGLDYEMYFYGVNDEGVIDYDNVLEIAKEVKPKMIICGASCYSRKLDFKKFREIADEVNAYLMVDMAHIAGLVCAGEHENPCPYAHVVTSTTHKTLRGPRGGLILTNSKEIIDKINRIVFPGIQGGPLMHVIGAKAVCFKEALEPSFKEYQKQVVKNAKTMAEEFTKLGYKVISGTTDNHLLSIDVKSSVGLTGKKAEQVLDTVNITVNKNTIPNDSEKPFITSGIRLGSPALTTRGLKEDDFIKVVHFIDRALRNSFDQEKLIEIKKEVIEFITKFEIFNWR